MPIRFVLSLPVIFFLLSCTDSNLPEKVAISYSPGIPQVDFSINELHKALTDKKILCVEDLEESSSGMSLKLSIDISLGYESYLINQEGNTIKITGGDGNGLMYAVLELTDMIRLEKKLTELGLLKASPYIKKRGLRFNIPLDARTPSYDDTGDAAQKNIETVWDFEFWKKYLDMMARNRYNLLTFWNLHPYPSWVKVPEYPDVALDDVCVYTGKIDANTDMKWRGLGIQNPDSLKVIKKITVDEKIAFWNKVFQYAEDRGIEIYIFHWNVFVNGAEGKHGIEWRQDSPITVDYIRKSVKQFLLTYPNIKGIGITAGEHINRELTGKYKTENWMWLTYGPSR